MKSVTAKGKKNKQPPKKKGQKVLPIRRVLQTSREKAIQKGKTVVTRSSTRNKKKETTILTSESRHTQKSKEADALTNLSLSEDMNENDDSKDGSRHTQKSKEADVSDSSSASEFRMEEEENTDDEFEDALQEIEMPNMHDIVRSIQRKDNIDEEDDDDIRRKSKSTVIEILPNCSGDEVIDEVDLQQKFSKIFNEDDVLIPRLYNRKPPRKYHYTVINENYMKDKVGKKESTEFYKIPAEQRNGFVIKLVESIVVGKTFYRFNEILEEYIVIDETELNQVVTKRLKNNSSDRTNKAKKYNRPVANTNQSVIFDIKEYTKKSSYMAFENLYSKANLAFNTKKWNMFSMFHSLFQSFSIYVYNYSHKLDDKEMIHRSTKVKLTFSEFCNCILVTHGRLVHSGAESKEEGPLSFNWSHDVRAFCYLSSFQPNDKKRELYTNFSTNNKVVRDTFHICKKNCSNCTIRRKQMCTFGDEYTEIKVDDHLKRFKENRKSSTTFTHHTQRAPVRILGDMKTLGWEIYTGVEFSLDKYQNLNAQIRDCVRGKGSKEWQGIGGTSRSAFKIDELLSDPSKKKLIESLPLVTESFTDIKNIVLKKIPYLGDNVEMQGRSLLANMDQVDEQKPHRDFKEIRKKL